MNKIKPTSLKVCVLSFLVKFVGPFIVIQVVFNLAALSSSTLYDKEDSLERSCLVVKMTAHFLSYIATLS